MKYQSVMDLHTHTVASGHAYCTLREMARAAPGNHRACTENARNLS